LGDLVGMCGDDAAIISWHNEEIVA